MSISAIILGAAGCGTDCRWPNTGINCWGTRPGASTSRTFMRPISFTDEDRRSLAHDRFHHPDPRVQRKMEVLWLKSHGLGHDDIATLAEVSRRTVQRYLNE